jgi:dihydroorotate dehydrogenase (fumarate)
MDITTSYLGFKLKSPIVPSAGPLSEHVSTIKEMEDAGAGAVVLHSLFEEQLEHDELELEHHTKSSSESFAEATSFFPEPFEYKLGPEEYLEHIRKAKEAVDIPIIASLNGKSLGGWIDYAKRIEEAGADALELNIYQLATDTEKKGEEIEKKYIHIVRRVRSEIKIPIAVKMHPFFSSIAYMANELSKAGANGLVLFNRFYHTEEDVIKMIMAGANVTQVLSCLLKYGIGHISEIITKLKTWMEEKEYESIEQMRGSMSYLNVDDPSKFERANYMKVLHSYK